MPNSLCSLCLQEKICPWQSVVMVFNFSEKHWLVFHGCPSPYMLILCIQLFWKYISLVNVLYMEVFKKLYKFSKTVDISFQIFPSHCLVFACFTQQVFFTLDVLIHSWGILGVWVILFYSYYTFNYYCSSRAFYKEVLTRFYFFLNYYKQLMVARERETFTIVMCTLANGTCSCM